MIRFIHAADLHLGSGQFISLERTDDFLENLSFILSTAEQEHAQFIILAGDVFDCLELLPYVYGNVLSIIDGFHVRTQNNIPIVAIEGNHDKRKFSKGSRFPISYSWLRSLALSNQIILLDSTEIEESNSILTDYDPLSKKGNVYKFNDVEIIGLGYCGETPMEQINQLIYELNERERPEYRVLMMHMGINGYIPGVPALPYLFLEDLHQQIDYLALGHFHLRFTIDNWVFNPGANEPVSYSEKDYDRGIFLCEFAPIDDVRKNEVRVFNKKNRPIFCLELRSHGYMNEEMILNQTIESIQHADMRSDWVMNKSPIVVLKINQSCPQKKKSIMMTKIKQILIQDYGVLDVKFPGKNRSEQELKNIRTLIDFI